MRGNEMAKDHVRFMVGGRCPGLPNERLFRFEFPERPGACAEFLQAIGSRWNIRSEEHTSELQSLMRISYAVFCLKKTKTETTTVQSRNRDQTSIRSDSN